MRANCIFFPISPRNSPAAVAHLLTTTEAHHFLIGPETALQNIADAAFKHIRAAAKQPPATSVMPSLDDLMEPMAEGKPKLLPRFNFRFDDIACIFHSSGI